MPVHNADGDLIGVTQLVNKVLRHGKRSTAERIVYQALDIVQTKTGTEDPVGALKRAVAREHRLLGTEPQRRQPFIWKTGHRTLTARR